MEITKQTLKKWMDEFGHNNQWLAKHCSVTPGTVSNWKSSLDANIPYTQMDTIRRLMEIDYGQSQNLLIQGFSVAQFKKFEEIAKRDGIEHVHDWAKDILLNQINQKKNHE